MSAKLPEEYLLATVCIAVLISVAFFAAYSGGRLEVSQQAPKMIADEQSKHSDDGPYRQEQSPVYQRAPPKSVSSNDLPKERSDDRNYGVEQGSEYWPSPIFGVRLKVTDSLLAAFTFFLVVIGAYQGYQLWKTVAATKEAADAAKISADVAKRTLLDIQRAFLVPIEFQCDPLVWQKEVIGYRVTAIFQNTGTTVAKGFAGTGNFVMYDTGLPDDFVYPDRVESSVVKSVVGPLVRTLQPINIVIQDILDIMNKKRRGFFYGWVEYHDVFDGTPKRRTEYCVEVEVIGDPKVINGERGAPSVLAFGSQGKYNGTDEDCFYEPGRRPPIGGLPEPTQLPPELVKVMNPTT